MIHDLHEPEFIYIDLFCGAGGTTTGITQAVNEAGKLIAIVAACVNHDPKAIKSHWLNHPEVEHFEEDIRTLELSRLVRLVNLYRTFYPHAKIVLWASLECTNFSKAKGGQPRDADSRTLADHLDRYIKAIDPDYIQIENVVEFMSWGPLDEHGKPLSRKNGQDWMRWRNRICSLGYRDEWKELNAADFGAYTSRNRLFGIFAKDSLPIAWPAATHSKKKSPAKDLFGTSLQPWKPVKDVLDFADEGNSIFGRKTELSEKTLERIYAGLIKFVAGGKDAFIAKTYSGRPAGKVISLDGPAGTITCFGGQSLVQPQFIVQRNGGDPDSRVVSVGPARTLTSTGGNQEIVNPQFIHAYYGNGDNNHSVNGPAPTLRTKDGAALVNPEFILNYHHSSDVNDINQPAATITTKDKYAKVHPEFIMRDFTNGGEAQSIEQPAGSLLSVPKMNLVKPVPFVMGTNFDNKPTSIEQPAPTITANRKWSYLVNPSWFGNPGSTEQPCPVIVARQDKSPLYLVMTSEGHLAIEGYETDSTCTKKIKEFMALYGIIDIKMRMLKVVELLKIQDFPSGYQLIGSQADQKKFIGNSVVPRIPKVWLEAMYPKTKVIKLNSNYQWEAVAA